MRGYSAVKTKMTAIDGGLFLLGIGSVMHKQFTFTIKEKDVRKHLVMSAVIDVPENWDDMSIEDQYEYLVRPKSDHMHPGQILYTTSRFQEATGAEEVVWFRFTSRRLA